MLEQNKNTDNVLKKSYQPTVVPLGESYKPIPKGSIPTTFIPPKGGTGACSVEIKTVNINTEKK